MPDVYSVITEVDPEMQQRLAEVIELRAADHRQKAMLESYLAELELPPEAVALEIGCGTGPVTRRLASWPGVRQAIGVDPSEVFIVKARELGERIPNLSFAQGDGRNLTFDDETFDLVTLHTTLCHVPEPERVLDEARRVLRRGGWLAVFDGDYAGATVAAGEFDPLEDCVRAFRESFVHDPWLVRRLPRLLTSSGFAVMPMRSHGYIEAPEGGYMLTWIDRGADVLVQKGHIDASMAQSLRAEARRRSEQKVWFGHIGFASVLAQKPGH